MKKAKIMFSALTSVLMTASATAVMTANANVDVRDYDEVAKMLDGYTKIEEPIVLAVGLDEFKIEDGTLFYVNNTTAELLAICPEPDIISLEITPDIDIDNFYDVVKSVCPDAKIKMSNDLSLFPNTKQFSIYDKPLSFKQANELNEKIGEKVIEFKLIANMYKIGRPLYGNDFTYYYSLSSTSIEQLQNFISENDIKCHIEVTEDGDVDVIPDKKISYSDEIAISSKIYCELGLKGTNGAILESMPSKLNGTEIDIHNSVQGDANCDDETNMADTVLIMQSLANPDKYSITAQGKYNSDNEGDGITNADALAIQKKLLKLD